MRPLVPSVALLLLPSLAAASVQARLTPEVGVGGGWASAIFIGDQDGAGWQSHVAPGISFDLSTGPVVKILSSYRLGWSRYQGDKSALHHDGELTLRLRLSPAVDLELRGELEQADFENLASSLSGDATSPPATASSGWGAGPALRWRLLEGTTAEASLIAGSRKSDPGDGETIDEQFQRGSLSLTHRFSHRVEAALRYRHVRNRTDAAWWSYDGDGGELTVAWVPGWDLILQAFAGLQWNRFEERTDRFGYAGLGALFPITGNTSFEAAWSWGENAVVDQVSGDADWSAVSGTRHVLWSGLRVEWPWWL